MQNDFVNEGTVMEVPMARKFVPNMKSLVETCRESGIPVIYTQHVLSDEFDISPLEVTYLPQLKESGLRPGTVGVEIIEDLAPLPDEIVIKKHRYDSFYNTQLETIIRNIRRPVEVDTVIITGTVTNVCCESTARAAFMRDFKVVFVSDGNGGFDEASHNATLNSIQKVIG
jgi:nicotinamidase-related amidase